MGQGSVPLSESPLDSGIGFAQSRHAAMRRQKATLTWLPERQNRHASEQLPRTAVGPSFRVPPSAGLSCSPSWGRAESSPICASGCRPMRGAQLATLWRDTTIQDLVLVVGVALLSTLHSFSSGPVLIAHIILIYVQRLTHDIRTALVALLSTLHSFNAGPVLIAHIILIHVRSEEHTSELQSLRHLVCRL